MKLAGRCHWECRDNVCVCVSPAELVVALLRTSRAIVDAEELDANGLR